MEKQSNTDKNRTGQKLGAVKRRVGFVAKLAQPKNFRKAYRRKTRVECGGAGGHDHRARRGRKNSSDSGGGAGMYSEKGAAVR